MSVCLGLFDSGVGGLTVLRSILHRHGPLPTVYLGDTARVPYGSRSPSEIRSIAAEVVAWLKVQKVSTVVMACNTTNALARDVAEGQAGVPVVGLIGAAAAMVRESRVGVLATPATVASGAYRESIEALNPGTMVVQQACPRFVPLIEAGDLSSPELRQSAINYLAPLLEASVESVILGCTHYPLLEPLLRSLLPPDVRLIDPAEAVARQLDALLGAPAPGRPDFPLSLGQTRLCVTADPDGFALRATPWLGGRPRVEAVTLR
ncbi:glutamate racemase [Synechococcus sp. UW140]|uniref:glutamate racemase n=1 Tax=Synechococcus sp. UW140 TaxID=368503 RepID=UPI000E0F11CA|nr:glutamate racemase [Synechococcus sp. UW140]